MGVMENIKPGVPIIVEPVFWGNNLLRPIDSIAYFFSLQHFFGIFIKGVMIQEPTVQKCSLVSRCAQWCHKKLESHTGNCFTASEK